MKEIDRRALTREILFGAAVAAAGLAWPSETANAMPLDDRIPGSLDDWIEKTQVWVGRAPPPAPRLALLVASRPQRLRVGSGCDQSKGPRNVSPSVAATEGRLPAQFPCRGVLFASLMSVGSGVLPRRPNTSVVQLAPLRSFDTGMPE